jgi:demethylmenaquinone methyltransferase/2-methoxy-6-polyprenyl-1,4-benzoquinol methylase
MLVARGARVEGFDLSPTMVAEARRRVAADGLGDRLTVREMGVESMDGLADDSYDLVVSTLVFSELGHDERRYALKHAWRVLVPGGRLVIADEVIPRSAGRRLGQRLLRAPLAAATYLVSRGRTRALAELAGEITAAGFVVDEERRSHGDAFALVVAHRAETP